MFGRINEAEVENNERLFELFRYSVIAFESMKQQKTPNKLENLGALDIETIGKVFNGIDEVSAMFYYQISKKRVNIIKALDIAVEDNQKEKVIHKFIFEHFGLLDPSWEMTIDVNPSMERTFRKEFDLLDKRLSEEHYHVMISSLNLLLERL